MQEHKIIKYLQGAASSSEEKEIEDWIISSTQNTKKFNLLKARYIASTFDETSNTVQVDEAYATFSNAMKTTSDTKYRRLIILKYVAMVAIVFGTGYFYISGFFEKDLVPAIPDDVITLQLKDGNIEIISEDGTTKVVDSKGNLVGVQQGTQLVYKNNESPAEELAYNKLTVPYGKRFDVVLSDGTHVFLNAGTSLRYPVKFIKGKNRQVYLKGEAFFDVAKDVGHPFVVNVDELSVKVLGTRFNISSYPEDMLINTTLVEGSVTVYENGDPYSTSTSSLLKPGYKAEWNKNDKNISIEETNVALHTAWVKGKIVFRHLPFKSIVKKLERHYNVVITNNNKILDDEFFTASFDIETIEQVFETFNKNYGIDYRITDDEIIIN
jgi:hypothetical protein